MGLLETMIGGVLQLVFYCLVFYGVHRLYVISTELTEIKELLKRRNDALPPPPLPEPRAWTVLDNDQ